MFESGFEGEWSDAFREIVINNSGWMRGVELAAAMGKVRIKAQAADTGQTRAALLDLRLALERLERQAEIYAQQAKDLRHQVGLLTAAVHAQHSAHVDPEPVDNGIPLEDELLERMSKLYGIREPKGRR